MNTKYDNEISGTSKAIISAIGLTEEELNKKKEELSKNFEFKTLQSVGEEFLKEREYTKMTRLNYDFVIEEFLPGIFSDDKETKERWFNYYTNVVSSPTSQTLVVNKNGEKVFMLPSVLEPTDIELKLKDGSVMPISMALLEAENKRDNNPMLANQYNTMIENYLKREYKLTILENNKKWLDLKERFLNKTLTNEPIDAEQENDSSEEEIIVEEVDNRPTKFLIDI